VGRFLNQILKITLISKSKPTDTEQIKLQLRYSTKGKEAAEQQITITMADRLVA
jgi:hypothetical protein